MQVHVVCRDAITREFRGVQAALSGCGGVTPKASIGLCEGGEAVVACVQGENVGVYEVQVGLGDAGLRLTVRGLDDVLRPNVHAMAFDTSSKSMLVAAQGMLRARSRPSFSVGLA